MPEAVTGFRSWVIEHDGLRSPGSGRLWSPGENEAQPPTPQSADGLAAAHTINGWEAGRGEVLGAILAWGEMVVTEEGFRAQFARVIGLCGRGAGIEDVALRYGVPHFTAEPDLAAEVQRHGRALDHSIRPSRADQQPGLALSSNRVPASADIYAPGQTPRMMPHPPAPHIWGPLLWVLGYLGLAEAAMRWLL